MSAAKFKEKWNEMMKKPGVRRMVIVALGILSAAAAVGLCILFYFRGFNDGKKKQESNAVTLEQSGQEAVTEASAAASVSGGAAQSTGEAVTGESVTGQAAASEGDAANPADTNADHQAKTKTGAGSQDTVQAAAAAAPASAYAGKLSVNGSQLYAGSSPIQLRGVSTHGLSWYPEYVNPAMFGELKAWGANAVRLAMYTAEYNGYCTGGSENKNKLKNIIKKGVQYATEQDLYVIIDWHILSDGNPNTYKEEAIRFFAEMADLYKDNDHVLYEICNEPNGGTNWAQIKSYAVDVIQTIRERDPDGVIIVGTPTWSQEVDKAAADPISGYSNIMYSLHFYADTHRDSLRNTLKSAVGSGLPVFVTEFGTCDASGNGPVNSQQADLWIQTLNQYGISYMAWALSNKAETCALLQAGCNKTSGIGENDLSENGKWLLRTLQGAAVGTDVQQPAPDAAAGGDIQVQPPVQNQEENRPQADQQEQTQNYPAQATKSPDQYTPQVSSGAEAFVVGSWQEGTAFCIQYEIKVGNTSGGVQEGWSAALTFPANAQVVSGWNANFTANGSTVNLTAMDYNKTIQPGGKAEGIGCIIRFE